MFGASPLLAAGAATLALTLTLVGPAAADGKLQEVLSRGTLIVGTGSTNPPRLIEFLRGTRHQ